MAITAKDVKTLREKTGAGMMDCKKALTDSDGDFEKAVMLLREKGLAGIQKRAGKVAAEGSVACIVEGNRGIMLEINCETDFVAKNDDFKNFVNEMAGHVLSSNKHDDKVVDDAAAELNDEPWYKDNKIKVGDVMAEKLATIGEKMILRRFASYTAKEGGISTYLHGGGRIGVMIEYATGNDSSQINNSIRDIAMHVAAINPGFLSRDEVTQQDLDNERALYKKQVIEQGKPEHIADKIVEGKMKKYYSEVCLLEQSFVKDPNSTIQQFLDSTAKEAGTSLKIIRFERFQVGEGVGEEK
jgi:elongation factor Ts